MLIDEKHDKLSYEDLHVHARRYIHTHVHTYTRTHIHGNRNANSKHGHTHSQQCTIYLILRQRKLHVADTEGIRSGISAEVQWRRLQSGDWQRMCLINYIICPKGLRTVMARLCLQLDSLAISLQTVVPSVGLLLWFRSRSIPYRLLYAAITPTYQVMCHGHLCTYVSCPDPFV